MLKRIFAGLCIVLILIFAGVYLLIPARIAINNNITVNTTDAHVFQFLTHQREWKKWWPGTAATDFKYKFHNNLYTIKQLNNEDVVLDILNPELTLNTQLSFVATDADKVQLNWTGIEPTGLNPIGRFNTYLKMNQIKKDLNEVLLHFKHFVEDDRNVYQINVRISQVKDSIILTTKTLTQHYPKTDEVYQLVSKLQQEIRKQKAVASGAPMLNVHQIELNKYEVMVGIPLAKTIEPPTGMFINKMVLGNIMETTVNGGLGTVQNGFDQMEKYKKDHHLISPAMPFESLITNRSKESDTAKWVTKIYYPIL